MGVIQPYIGIETRGGYQPASFARDANESAFPGLWDNLGWAFVGGYPHQDGVIVGNTGISSTSGLSYAKGNRGQFINYYASSNYLTYFNQMDLLSGLTDATAVLHFFNLSSSFSSGNVVALGFGYSSGTSGTNNLGIEALRYNSGKIRIDYAVAGVSGKLTSNAVNVWLTPFCAIARRRGSTLELFINGDLDATATISSAAFTGSDEVCFGQGNRNFTQDCGITAASIYQRALSDAECRLISIDPFAAFRRRPLLIPLSSAGTGTTKIVSDAASASDSLAQNASIGVLETVSGVESLSGHASISITDLGNGLDALSQSAMLSVADSTAALESLSTAVQAFVTDLASAVDAPAITVILSISDIGIGADSANVPGGTVKAIADAASAFETVKVQAALSLSEAGSASESLSLGVVLSITDAGAASDIASTIQSLLIRIAESVAGSDALSISASIGVTESAQGTESQIINVLAALADSGAVVDTVTASGSTAVKITTISFTLSQPGLRFTLRQPKIEFTLN